jgi:pentapeptide repeat protein
VVLAWVLFVPAADWLAHHDVGSVTGSLHETALDNARGRLLTLGAGLFAAGALVFTARNFTVSRRTLELTEQGQVTDRYTKAIEQLGSEKLDVRIGGIYALERVARDSARDHPTVMEVLTAFIREHSREHWPPPDHPAGRERERSTRPDVQAAVTVVGRRDAKRDIRQISLTDADLTRADLNGASLTRANFTDADLSSASLFGADLTRASLTRADLNGAALHAANLTDANLIGAVLIRAHLAGADLPGADLTGADLTGASLIGAVLTGANLGGADLTGADLARAVLTGAVLTGAVLTGARWPADTPVPEGWKLDAGSGRLEQAGTDSGSAEDN